MDIRIYKANGEYVDTENTSEHMAYGELSDSGATGVEVIANRVVKFLLTSIGSDVFDSDYGAYLPTYTQISRGLLPKLRLEIMEDLRRCASYIQQADAPLDGTLLSSLTLQDLVYNENTDRTRIDVYIQIVTDDGTCALLQVPYSA